MNEAIQDGVAQSGVADNVVPMFDGDLAGDDGGGATVAIIEDLQQVAPFGRTENRKAPVVEDQELNAADGFEQAAIAAVAASQGKLVSYANRQPGDLLFYTDGGGDMYHVTIYSGNGNMIEAPYEGQNVREVPVRGYQLVGQVARFSG